MFDKLHSYPKYFIFFTAISLLFALPVFADSTKKRTRNTSQNQNQNSEVKLTTFDATVAYNIWNEYYLAQEQGIDFPLPVFKPNANPESVKQLMAMWNEGKQKAYKESVRRFQQKSKANQQTSQQTTLNQTTKTKTLNKFDVNVAYKIWKDYYLTQEQGINPPPPNFQPLNANEQETNRLIAIWNKGKEKAHKETLKRREDARTGKLSFQAKPITPLVSDPSLPVQTIPTPNALTHIIRKPKGMAGISAFTANPISQPNQIQTIQNSQNSIIINANNSVNRSIAEQNKENISYNVAKAKEIANIAYPLIDNPGVTTQYLTDTNNITGLPQVVEELQNGQVVRQYSYGADGLISMRQLINNEWIVSFFIKDGHGSVRMLTDVNSNITDTYDYDAFGNLINRTGNTPNTRLFAGEEFDPDLGFYYLRARFLNAVTGRFISQDEEEGDIYDPQSLHKYTYANNNPITNFDPTGKSTIVTAQLSIQFSNIIAALPGFPTNLLTRRGGEGERKTIRDELCDIKLATIFGGYGAIAAGSGYDVPTLLAKKNDFDPYAYRDHLYKYLHIYGSKDGNGITNVLVPTGGRYVGKYGKDAGHKFFYENLEGLTNVTLLVAHVANFAGFKLNQKVESGSFPFYPAFPIYNSFSVSIGNIGGTGGDDAGYKHSHLNLTKDPPKNVRFTASGSVAYPIPFSQVFCK